MTLFFYGITVGTGLDVHSGGRSVVYIGGLDIVEQIPVYGPVDWIYVGMDTIPFPVGLPRPE
jgi:hypothetical protein